MCSSVLIGDFNEKSDRSFSVIRRKIFVIKSDFISGYMLCIKRTLFKKMKGTKVHKIWKII